MLVELKCTWHLADQLCSTGLAPGLQVPHNACSNKLSPTDLRSSTKRHSQKSINTPYYSLLTCFRAGDGFQNTAAAFAQLAKFASVRDLKVWHSCRKINRATLNQSITGLGFSLLVLAASTHHLDSPSLHLDSPSTCEKSSSLHMQPTVYNLADSR
jgi:hypothetical protein